MERESFMAYQARRKSHGRSARTLNNTAAAVNGFLTWCLKGKRIDENPLACVPRIDEAAEDKRRVKRALFEAEIRRLLSICGRRELCYRGHEGAAAKM